MSIELIFEEKLFNKHLSKALADKPIDHFCLQKLDSLLGGVRSQLTIICGEPASGKTTLLHQLADDLAQTGYPVLFFSFEIAAPALIKKSLIRMSNGKLNDSSFGTGKIHSLECNVAERYRGEIAPHIAIFETPIGPIEIGAIVGLCEQTTEEKPIVFLDYVQLMPSETDQMAADERLAIKASIAGLRRIVNSHEVPVYAISSVNRSSYGKTIVGLDSLGGSSAVEYAADQIVFLAVDGRGDERRENSENPLRPVTATLLKNRYGPTGNVRLTFDAEHACFQERI